MTNNLFAISVPAILPVVSGVIIFFTIVQVLLLFSKFSFINMKTYMHNRLPGDHNPARQPLKQLTLFLSLCDIKTYIKSIYGLLRKAKYMSSWRQKDERLPRVSGKQRVKTDRVSTNGITIL
jgi:hypothetical protein